MSNELTTAAERLLSAEYGEVTQELVCIGQELARAYLAEHPDQPGQPITEAWLREIGFKDDRERPYLYRNAGYGRDGKPSGSCDVRWLTKVLCIELADEHGRRFRLPEITTRDQLQRLLTALGIGGNER